MLTDRQIEIADFLLKYLSEKEGTTSNLDDYPDKLKEQGFGILECDTLIKILIGRLEFIDYAHENEYYIVLTPEGLKAAKIGVREYFEQIEEEKQLDREAKRASIKGVKKANRNSVIAILIALCIPLTIAIMQHYLNNIVDTKNNRNEDSSIGTEINHSQHPFNFADTVFIEKLTNTLIHDTLFLNELKLLINSELKE